MYMCVLSRNKIPQRHTHDYTCRQKVDNVEFKNDFKSGWIGERLSLVSIVCVYHRKEHESSSDPYTILPNSLVIA